MNSLLLTFQLLSRWLGGLLQKIATKRNFLVLAGIIACFYAVAVMYHVSTVNDVGIKTLLTPKVCAFIRSPSPEELESGPRLPDKHDIVVKIGPKPVTNWPTLLRTPREIHQQIEDAGTVPTQLRPFVRLTTANTIEVLVEFAAAEDVNGEKIKVWRALEPLPFEEVVPTILWFVLKILLFGVGVLVFWKRPNQPASVQFYLLCVVTLMAFMGGWHWSHICTERHLIVLFMISSVLLPPVTLHFYLLFPRPKALLQRHRRTTLSVVYVIPLAFLVILLICYYQVRSAPSEKVEQALDSVRLVALIYVGVATLWYLASVVALVHSYFAARDVTERNQVKFIALGACIALIPIGYSGYLILFDKLAFGAGHATWPMFGASLCFTAAFSISTTRYRLMELDQIVSSSATYFIISFAIGLAYYAVLLVVALIFTTFFNDASQGLTSPSTDAIRVGTIALVLMVLLDLARSRFKRALDQRFNREKYHLDRTLQKMGDAVQQLVDPQTLVQGLLHATSDLLGVSRGAVYLRSEDGTFRLAGWVGPAPAQMEIHGNSPLIEELSQHGVAILPRRDESENPVHRILTTIDGELARALTLDGRLLAFLLLGAKATPPYRQEDLNLLEAFSQITALALGNAQGHHTIETLNNELQSKIEKIAEQQRRIMALQSQLRQQRLIQESETRSVSSTLLEEKSQVQNTESSVSSEPTQFTKIVGSSSQVRSLLGMVRKVAKTDSVVLIRGESGTGKELFAEAVHHASGRADKAFVKVHCAALSPTLLESELFGHVKGAFTGAHRDKTGRFELASGGTLFLDEIGDISLDVQTKLLRVLQEQTFERVGSSETINVDVRIIAATHQHLEQLIEQGRFREDLYYRLNVFPIQIPPLRQRPEDIIELAVHFLQTAGARCEKTNLRIDDDALELLRAFHWPGNIRQLENVLERAVVLAEDSTITAESLPEEVRQEVVTQFTRFETGDSLDRRQRSDTAGFHREGAKRNPPTKFQRRRDEFDKVERDELLRALEEAEGNKAQAARNLGIPRSTFLSRLKKYGVM
ncbi:MAG: sigma 54-interacting transcriptional regulator [Gemmataceae bacterium]